MFEERTIVSLLNQYKNRSELTPHELLDFSFNGVSESDFVFWVFGIKYPLRDTVDKHIAAKEMNRIMTLIEASIKDDYLERTPDGKLKIISAGHRLIQDKYFYTEFLPKTFGYFGTFVIGIGTSTLFIELIKLLIHLIEKLHFLGN